MTSPKRWGQSTKLNRRTPASARLGGKALIEPTTVGGHRHQRTPEPPSPSHTHTYCTAPSVDAHALLAANLVTWPTTNVSVSLAAIFAPISLSASSRKIQPDFVVAPRRQAAKKMP